MAQAVLGLTLRGLNRAAHAEATQASRHAWPSPFAFIYEQISAYNRTQVQLSASRRC
jgi:hypothetical protein